MAKNTSRKISQLLPEVYQTDTLTKFLSSTADNLFQPENVEFINGYIGSTPSYFNSAKDFYIGEPTRTRANYQLTPAAVSVDHSSGVTNSALFYDDLINQLRFQGANVDNHTRLFEQEYYSWSPPVDLDKFINYSQYFWLPYGPSSITLLNPTDAVNTIENHASYTYVGTYRLDFSGEIVNGSFSFSSGMKIRFTDDAHAEFNDIDFIIENVGRSIVLYNPAARLNPSWDTAGWSSAGWDGDPDQEIPDYSTIQRGSRDQNQWSAKNHWYHRDIILFSGPQQLDENLVRARRPIIEFDRDTELYNHGVYGRGTISIVIPDIGNVFGKIVGQPSYSVNGINLVDGMRVLIVNDIDASLNNRIYQVTGLAETGYIQLSLVNNGQNLDGSPAYGDNVFCIFGDTNPRSMLWYNGSAWVYGQLKTTNIAPLFSLYDSAGNRLLDPSVYPSSTFTGSTVFEYAQDPASTTIDAVLGIPLKLDQFGDFVFNNTIVTNTYHYQQLGKVLPIEGYQFVRVDNEYRNDWYRAPTTSRQYLVNEYNIGANTTKFPMDWVPDESVANQLPTVYVTIIRNQNSITLVRDTDYTVNKNIVTLSAAAVAGDRVLIRSWSSQVPPAKTHISGYFELPLNLVANPNNLPVTSLSRSTFLNQFVDIMNNQTMISGKVLGSNNWRDTARNKGLGTRILQHRAPMVKLMLMNSQTLANTATQSSTVSSIDLMSSIEFTKREYQNFYSKFIKSLFNLYNSYGYNSSNEPNSWITSALKQINLVKTLQSPFANSGYDQLQGLYCSAPAITPTYIPPTPTRLGVAPAFKPEVYVDYRYSTPQMVMQTHDGSRIVLQDPIGNSLGTILDDLSSTSNPYQLTHPVAAAWLQFELNIFNNLPSQYSSIDAELTIDERTIKPGKWRNSTYTRNEYLQLERTSFEKWCTLNQVDYRPNTTYQDNNQFTFNYRTCVDQEHHPVPGHWQGMYQWFYDTDRPHSHPWEMLGFSQKPTWWDVQYGAAPYTNGNTLMWQDLAQGLIRQGDRAGPHAEWARPGLLKCIPVDNQGNLLPPYQAGCVRSLPGTVDAAAAWVFGDVSALEQVWRYSQEGAFARAQVAYLARPAQFVEYAWDPIRTEEIFKNTAYSQWIYLNTNGRRSSAQFYVHEENPQSIGENTSVPTESALTYFGSCGIQHWISEYLISQNLSVTKHFGNIIRGGNVRLGHKCAGYVSTDSLRVLADSFGQVGYQSQIIPSENIHTYLYRSNSIGEYFYSGVIISQQSNGWMVLGYDSVDPAFTVVPHESNSHKTKVVVGNQTVVEYTQGRNATQRVSYGSVFPTRQDVYNFLIDYGRWLKTQGWVFDTVADDNTMITWNQMAKEFLFWSQGSWTDGTVIALSPLGSMAKFSHTYGTVQLANGAATGSYSVLDKNGVPIETNNLLIMRDQNIVTVSPTNSQTIYGLRLFVTTLEHAILFDNTTSFNDIIYQPQFNLAQPRLKILAYRTNNWTGRLDAPGYFLSQDTRTNTWSMVPNLEKTADDMRRYFNVDQPTSAVVIEGSSVNLVHGSAVTQQTELAAVNNQTLSDLSKHLVGYQKRDYLQNLLLEDSVEFEFYQGFIRQKGTKKVIDAMLRNTYVVPGIEKFEYYEEYGLRAGAYGATDLNNILEFNITPQQVINNPQLFEVYYDGDTTMVDNATIRLTTNDPRIISQPRTVANRQFPLRHNIETNTLVDLSAGGYVMVGETTWTVYDTAALHALYDTQTAAGKPIAAYDTVWQVIDSDTGGWMVWQLLPSAAAVISTEITSTLGNTGDLTTINFNGDHGIKENDKIVVFGVTNAAVVTGTFTAINVTNTTVDVAVSSPGPGLGGTVWVYNPVRFSTAAARNAHPPIGGWTYGQPAWVDNVDKPTVGWTVYNYTIRGWTAIRSQNIKVDPTKIQRAVLYRNDTYELLDSLVYYDPIKGIIPGVADKEIDYKTTFDPAAYNHGDSSIYNIQIGSAWGLEKVGTTWWDLSTARYIDYETGEDSYRAKYWGKFATGSTITVYEWVRSPIAPADWTSYVAQGRAIAQYGLNYIPSGTVHNADNPAYTQTIEYDISGTAHTWYYFWVGNSSLSPQKPTRTMSTLAISQIVADPTAAGISWYAVISKNSLVMANVKPSFQDTHTVFQITYGQPSDGQIEYTQWKLSRDGDPSDKIDNQFWSKMRDSLTGHDQLGNLVPDIGLSESTRYGNLIRPRQSWFKDRIAAITVWVNKVNELIAAQPVPLVDNPDIVGWLPIMDSSEPTPDSADPVFGWLYHVSDLPARNQLITQGKVKNGNVVLVDPIPDTGNLWTLQQWTGTEWIVTRIQSYATNHYWQYTDWYAAGFGSTTTAAYTVNYTANLSSLPASTGTIAKVLNDGTNRWQLYEFNGTSWILIGQQNGSIVVNITYQGWDSNGWDSTAFDKTPDAELGYIFDAVYSYILATPNSGELNTLFFTMLNYVFVEQGFVDWAIKTSFIVLKGFNQPFDTGSLYVGDLVESLLSFINEAKPYHTKLREFISGRTSLDIANTSTSDFDKPVYNNTVLNPPADAVVLSTDPQYTAWYNNYQTHPQLIRTLKTQLVFDRITGIAGNSGAAARIVAYYAPTEFQPPRDDLTLIDSDYKGTVLSGLPMSSEKGWSVAPWNQLGWDPTNQSIDDFIDLAIQAGIPPTYNTFYGTNVLTSFRLSYIPQDVANTVVWVNKQLKQYGTDWYINNWVSDVRIVDPGKNYQVGDHVLLQGGEYTIPTTIEVMTVDAQGSITQLKIIETGNYRVVPPFGSISSMLAPYSASVGSNASFEVTWKGSTLTFAQAPLSEPDGPSVFVLFAGTTFGAAPDSAPTDTIYDGNSFIQPDVEVDHAPELYNARLTNVLTLDCTTVRTGGAPVITNEYFDLDGSTDQVHLAQVPQNQDAILVYYNGMLLNYGNLADYVVNFESAKLVFVRTPTAGKLRVVTFGEGGAGLNFKSIYVNNPGSNYRPSDIIQCAGGAGTPALVRVATVTAVKVTLSSSGYGFKVGDIIVESDNTGSASTRLSLLVTATDVHGAVTNFKIITAGSYTAIPLGTTFTNNGTGHNLYPSVVWGVETVDIVDPGSYTQLPAQPMAQANSSSYGTGVELYGLFTSIISTDIFQGDGVLVEFALSAAPDSVNNTLVVVDGMAISNATYSVSGNTLIFSGAPAAGSRIKVTAFNTTTFSTIHNNSFVIQLAQSAYNLDVSPASTQPNYLSTLVYKNGLRVQPPAMMVYATDGVIDTYPLPGGIYPGASVTVTVFLGGVLMTELTDYVLNGDNVTFGTAPTAGQTVVIVAVDTNGDYGYQFINGTQAIQLQSSAPGDIVNVLVFTEDQQYGFITERYYGNLVATYTLALLPYDAATVLVSINGITATAGQDYIISNRTVQFNTANHISSDIVVITYTTGVPCATDTKFRLLSNDNHLEIAQTMQGPIYTTLLSNMYVNTSEIEIADYTVLGMPTDTTSGMITINNERIAYWGIRHAGNTQYPNRAFLLNIQRNRNGTSGTPTTKYNVLAYNGNGVRTTFNTPSGASPIALEAVFVDGVLQLNTEFGINGTYNISFNGLVRQVNFNTAPPVGVKNVIITSLVQDNSTTNICHLAGSTVMDSSPQQLVPGGYKWEPTPLGSQHCNSVQYKFLLDRANYKQ